MNLECPIEGVKVVGTDGTPACAYLTTAVGRPAWARPRIDCEVGQYVESIDAATGSVTCGEHGPAYQAPVVCLLLVAFVLIVIRIGSSRKMGLPRR